MADGLQAREDSHRGRAEAVALSAPAACRIDRIG